MPGFDVEISVSQNVTVALQSAIDAAIDLTPVMGDIAGHLADTMRDRFETSTTPDGVPWVPSQRVKDHGGKTLVLSGDLMNSITEDWGADYAAAGPEASGGAAIYAKIHQTGGTIRAKAKKALSFAGRIVAAVRIPARPYAGWNDTNSAYVVDTIGDALMRAFSQPGFSA